jgi:AcrR family transcriptional regulator
MPRRSEAQREFRRSQILQAALRRFARTGFYATTMEDVALEAGVSKGAPYMYFESKEALVRAIHEWWDCGLAQSIDTALAALTAAEQQSTRRTLQVVLRAVGDHVTEEPDACRVLMEARAQAHYLPGIGETVRASQVRAQAGLEQLIRAGVARGEWPAHTDPVLQARLLLAALHGLMDQWHLQPGSFSWPEAAAVLAGQLPAPTGAPIEATLLP